MHAVIASDLRETVLFVSHGSPIRAILAEALDIPLGNLFRIAQRYGAVTGRALVLS
jgi:broad specificity phosphatase PhoE